MLKSERDTDDADAAAYSDAEMEKSDLDSTDQNPYYIHEYCQTSVIIWTWLHFMSERPQGECSDLDELDSERDSDDGDAQKKADNPVIQGDQKSSEDHP